jgi:hypothetical protein
MLVIVFKILPWQKAIRNGLFITLIALAVTLPWTIRNYAITHTVIPVSNVGTVLIGAYNDMVVQKNNTLYGLWWLPAQLNGDFHPHSPADEQADAKQALAWIDNHRNLMPSLLTIHLLHMWTPYINTFDGLPFEEFPDRLSSKIVRDMIPLMSIPIFLLAAVGLLVTWKRSKKQLLVVYLVIALTIVQNIVFYGSPRFRAPIEPLLVVLAGGALWWLICRELGTLSSVLKVLPKL